MGAVYTLKAELPDETFEPVTGPMRACASHRLEKTSTELKKEPLQAPGATLGEYEGDSRGRREVEPEGQRLRGCLGS
eukprot:7579358-Pyramimonas_sp.AAC.1